MRKYIFVLLIVLCAGIINGCGEKTEQEFKPITEQEIQEIIEKKETAFIYYGQEMCGACIHMQKILDQLPKETKLKIRYLDADSIEESTVLHKYDIEHAPTLILIANGNVTKFDQEYDENSIKRLVESTENLVGDRVGECIEINYNDLQEKMDSNIDFVLYIGREDCHTCGIFEPILNSYIEENEKAGVYYFSVQEVRDKAKAENAEQADVDFYERLTEEFSIEWVPSLYYIRNGVIVSKFEYLDTEYYALEADEEKKNAEQQCEDDFKGWMKSVKNY